MDANAWIDGQPEGARPVLRALLARITASGAGPAAEAGGMLVFRPFRYRYASGREGDTALIAVAVRKGGVAVYVNSVRGDGSYLPEAHAAQLGKVKVGRSCITVKKLEQLDLDAFERVIREALSTGGAGEIRSP